VLHQPAQMPPPPRPALDPTEAETVLRWTEQGRKKVASDPPKTPCP
jgi:hypothetical protein